MQKFKLHSSAVLAAILLLAACSFNKEEIEKPKVKEFVTKRVNYDSMCIIGKKYIIYGIKFDKNNPFEEQPKAEVIITAKKNGYVQYCRQSDFKNKEKCLFTRCCKDFVESMNCR